MGRHSRRGPAPKPAKKGTGAAQGGAPAEGAAPSRGGFPSPGGSGERPPLPTRNSEASWHESGAPSAGPYRGNGAPQGGVPQGTPPYGFPPLDGTPARGYPSVRGGHPEQREAGGGWGSLGEGGAGRPSVVPRPRVGGGPRQEYVDAFGDGAGQVDGGGRAVNAVNAINAVNVVNRSGRGGAAVHAAHAVHMDVELIDQLDRRDDVDRGIDHPSTPLNPVDPVNPDVDAEAPAPAKSAKGRAFTGIAAAAVTTVLAVVVAGQVADDGGDDTAARTESQSERSTQTGGAVGVLPSPSAPAGVKPLSYDEKMAAKYPLAADLKGSGKFDAVPGVDKAPGKGRKYTYRVDVEQGIGLDGGLFAQAVQKTLNDNRSWAHNGARTFERIYSGRPDFVITLASPGTTAFWCDKSGLDTTQDNVSCNSTATERVMINAYRWAQGSPTYGDQMHLYRQMLINHEVGHRLGYGHETCDKEGDLAPVMQQQTKFLVFKGIRCRPNPWAYPGS
ncbi:DUF3152 domain-containing protein [Streptomyces niveiscabiei]|uniref:DUF3152 domain-containing protein n=2 Tax=Streptomyces niveiscabiei TaxID=164115 RepID=UPI003EBCA8CE